MRKAMYYGGERRREGLRALLSVAVIAAGFVVSNMAASSHAYSGTNPEDVVGVWRWVEPAGDANARETPLVEIRRAADGALEALIQARSGDIASPADISFDSGHLCVVTRHGASFKGRMSDDGLLIEGVLQYEGARLSAQFQRVAYRKLRRATGRSDYAT